MLTSYYYYSILFYLYDDYYLLLGPTSMWTTPLSGTSTQVTIVVNVDPRLAYVPYWLLNLVTKQLAQLLFEVTTLTTLIL